MRATRTQQKLIDKATAEWADLPSGVGCTNSSLEALARRGFVELRIVPGKESRFYGGWQWRLTPRTMTYRYALVNRPAGIGCTPRDLDFTVEPRPAAGAPHHDQARHGILVAARALTTEELASFELAPLVDGPELDALGARVAAGHMGDYRAEYIELAQEEPEEFLDAVLHAVRRLDAGVVYSIGEPARLVDATLAALREALSAR